jgi:hypothetical protein
MATLQQRITELAQGIGADVKALRAADGSLSSLSTTSKANLVAAINEIYTLAQTSTALINDAAGDGVTNKTWSADKIYDSILASINALRTELEDVAVGDIWITTNQFADSNAVQAHKGYVYRQRRGLGSTDVAITAYGANGADLPSTALLAEVQAALEVTAVAHEDVRAYAPDAVPLDVHATLTGRNIDQAAIQSIIEDYLDGLEPAEPYRESVLTGRIIGHAGVTDVQLTPNTNIYPLVDWTTLEWLRRGAVTVA